MFASVFIEAALKGYGTMAVVFLILTPIELIFRRGEQPLALRRMGLGFWAIAIPFSAFCATALSWLWAQLGIRPLLNLDMSAELGLLGPVAMVVAPLIGALIGDFFGYWYHRVQHKWLWRIHAVHHSIRNLSAVNSYHHFGDALFTTLLVSLPTSLLVVGTGPTVAVMALLMWLQPVFLHSPTSLHLGPLRHIIADNRFHRIHHSVEPHHYDKNFAILFSFWDRLFGTAHFPAPDEWPEVGLVNIAEPETFREWLDLPFRYSSESLPADSPAQLEPATLAPS